MVKSNVVSSLRLSLMIHLGEADRISDKSTSSDIVLCMKPEVALDKLAGFGNSGFVTGGTYNPTALFLVDWLDVCTSS